jgi:hypothetical protein
MHKNLIPAVIIILLVLLNNGCNYRKNYISGKNASLANVVYTGVRSSSYGIKPFPEPQTWQQIINDMQMRFKGAQACALWIVGVMDGKSNCRLEFPADGRHDSNVVYLDYDKHEPFLTHFDSTGIKVFLQVEPADANVPDLIDIVLDRYQCHPCVIGFGVDLEWFREAENPEWGSKVTDALARAWNERVKSHNPNYRLFLKHWDRDWMPPTYRSDLIFVDDSQELKDLQAAREEFIEYWSDYFKPNMVFFQVGYRSDRKWWHKLNDPPRDLGVILAQNIAQECGVFWVDFTLREVLLSVGQPSG